MSPRPCRYCAPARPCVAHRCRCGAVILPAFEYRDRDGRRVCWRCSLADDPEREATHG